MNPLPLYVLGPGARFANVGQVLGSRADVQRALREGRQGRWILVNSRHTERYFGALERRDTFHRLLVLEAISSARRELLSACFRAVLAPGDGVWLVPPTELVEILRAPNVEDLLIGGVVDTDDGQLVLFRGTFERIVVPLRWFRRTKGGPAPDPTDFEIIDGGQTVRLGDYEAAASAILYDVDPAARRRMKNAERRVDDSLGGALRRLRLDRGVRREEFGGLSAKTIARIERGEVQPRAETLRVIAKRLGVKPHEIQLY